MSTIAVNAITDANGGNTTSINNTTPTVYNTVGKNRIINGNMMIDQRNDGAEVTNSNSQYTVDRFDLSKSATSTVSFQQNQGSVTPPTGFINYLGFTTTTSSSPSSSEYVLCRQRIEGFNITDLGWGTVNAVTVTLSFWVRSSLTGTFGGSLRNNGNNRSYVFSYTISSANTWEKKSITIAGDTTGTWATTNGTGITLTFSLGSGSDYLSTADSWQNGNYQGVSGQTNIVSTNGATWQITGVQLEVGETATEFEHRPYPIELQLCHRYYQIIRAHGGSRQLVGLGYGYDGDDIMGLYHLTVPLRTNQPTMSFNGVCLFLGSTVDTNTIVFALNNYPAVNHTVIAINVDNTGSPAIAARDCIAYGFTSGTSANYIDVDAEL